jgi:hypothetical protein
LRDRPQGTPRTGLSTHDPFDRFECGSGFKGLLAHLEGQFRGRVSALSQEHAVDLNQPGMASDPACKFAQLGLQLRILGFREADFETIFRESTGDSLQAQGSSFSDNPITRLVDLDLDQIPPR